MNVSLKANERFMMEMFCARDFKAFPVLLYRFAKKTLELCCGLFLNADSKFFNSHDLAVLPALLIMVYLNSLYLKLVFTLRNQRIPV